MSRIAEPVDVVVVGSGASGSVYAAMLAEAGKSVLVLEGGGARKLSDLYSSQVWARRLKWAATNIINENPGSLSVGFNSGQGYGGAAAHHYGVWLRFHPEDFRERTLHGRSLDWPFAYSDLSPFYDRIQREVGISGDAAREIWRPPGEPYPLPPITVGQHGKSLARGFEALGMHTAPLPLAVLSQPYQGRPPCIRDGWCDAGCPTGALANPLVTYLPRATKAHATLKAGAWVTRVLSDSGGRRARGVEYRTRAGETIVQPAQVVVLCAFTVENARILLNSQTGRFPRGIANSSGLIGHYLMTHPSVLVSGLFSEQTLNHLGLAGGELLCQDAFRKDGPTAFGSRQWVIALALKPNDLLGIALSRPQLFGEDLRRFIREGAHFMGSMVALCQDQPLLENRIELASQKDPFGMPLARVVYRGSTDGQQLAEAAGAEGVEILKAAGAREAWHGAPAGQHILGGAIMGTDSGKSVVNAECQSHDVPNLFVAGPSVFPTSSAVNPTFTVHALALKSSEFIAKNWGSLTA